MTRLLIVLTLALAVLGNQAPPTPLTHTVLTPATVRAWMRAPRDFGQPAWIGQTR